MGILKIFFLISLFFLSSCKFQDNLLGGRPSIDSSHAPPLAGVVELGISTVQDQVIDEDSSTEPVIFEITGIDLDCTTNVTASSNNTSIIDSSGITFASSGESCSVVLTPEANANGGPVVITLTVANGDIIEETNFNLTVNPVSDPFTIMGEVANGQILEVDDYGPDYSTSSSHQWLSDGIPVPGAIDTTFDVTLLEEGTTITLELDGVQISNNSLITEYYSLYANENRFMRISNSRINGVNVNYDNLVRTVDEGNGQIAFNAGANSTWNKTASSTNTFKNPGDILQITAPNPPVFTSYAIGWGPVATANAVSSLNRIIVVRGGGGAVYSVRLRGVQVFPGSGNASGSAATFEVERTVNGFTIRRNGVVLHAD